MIKLATLCYLQHGEQTLMIERIKKANDIHRGKFNGLGGKLEKGESPEQCVIREVHEESGLRIKHPHLVGLLTFPNFIEEQDWYVYVFTADQFSGRLKESDEGKLAWHPTKDLGKLNLWQGDRYFLRWIAQKRSFCATFYYHEKQLRKFSVTF